MNGGSRHALLECKGCETVFYEKVDWDSEDIDHIYLPDGTATGKYVERKSTFPKPDSKSRPPWLELVAKKDGLLHKILAQVYVAIDNEALILAAVGLRTAFDRATAVLNIDASKTLQEKLIDLKEAGHVGQTEYDSLKTVTEAGNAAAHRSWEPSQIELKQLVVAIEIFVQRAFVLGDGALNVQTSIPSKPKRQIALNT